MDNTYIFILNTDGSRLTTYIAGVHADTNDDCLELAKTNYPNNEILIGDAGMQGQFLDGMVYLNGKFTNPEIDEKPIKIKEIKSSLDKQINELRDAITKRLLSDQSIDDLKVQYKKVLADAANKIKEIQNG